MRLGTLTLFATIALMTAANANAHLIAKPHCTSLPCRASSQLKNLKHARFVCHNGRHYAKRWSCAAVKWLTREYSQTKAAMRPRVAVSSHWQGWMCIHGHEGNGDSPNGLYHGPLQMTEPWAGHYVDWNNAPMSTVFAIAEAEARSHGYNYTWMQGQWPNTYPPCASYFG